MHRVLLSTVCAVLLLVQAYGLPLTDSARLKKYGPALTRLDTIQCNDTVKFFAPAVPVQGGSVASAVKCFQDQMATLQHKCNFTRKSRVSHIGNYLQEVINETASANETPVCTCEKNEEISYEVFKRRFEQFFQYYSDISS